MKYPIVRYSGGKGKLLKEIIPNLPRQGRYFVDCFAGGGNVLIAAVSENLQFDYFWLNDPRTAPFFQAVKRIGHKITIPETHEEVMRRDYYKYKEEKAHQFSDESLVMERFLSFDGAGFERAGPRCKGGISARSYQWLMRRLSHILRTKPIVITDWDWKQCIVNLDKRDFLFADPPYWDSSTPAYRSSDVNHIQMLRILRDAPFRWTLCSYKNRRFDEELGRKPFWTAPAGIIRRGKRGVHTNRYAMHRVEALWRNF